jgi:hypothetical protein
MKKSNFLNININSDDYQSNEYIILFNKFGTQPNKIILNDSYTSDLFINSIIQKNHNSVIELMTDDDNFIINEKILSEIDDDVWISYFIIDKDTDESIITDVTIYYKNYEDVNKVKEIIDKISQTSLVFEEDNINSNKFNTFIINSGNLEIETIYSEDIDNKFRYNDETIKQADKLSRKINKNKKGLSIIWGEKGVGKTNISKHIASNTDKTVIFIPNNMIDLTINNPEFLTFLSKLNNLLLIIDDCEFLTSNQLVKVNSFSNNISQLIDGVISDKIDLHILLIFNVEDIDDIDEDILDINNLIDIMEIDYLSPDVATELSKLLNKGKKYKSPIKLIDVLRNKSITKIDKIGL